MKGLSQRVLVEDEKMSEDHVLVMATVEALEHLDQNNVVDDQIVESLVVLVVVVVLFQVDEYVILHPFILIIEIVVRQTRNVKAISVIRNIVVSKRMAVVVIANVLDLILDVGVYENVWRHIILVKVVTIMIYDVVKRVLERSQIAVP